ncbi:MAG: DUF3800 domain-containing protein [Candidatus Kapabacteria bacterium]|nr:DUF3800 domain-containing protein [Candidatus Kapabacteria bacterium]
MIPASLFGEPAPKKQAHFYVYHDESEPEPNKGWLLIGLLFVNKINLSYVESSLDYHRRQENYTGEIHFCKLPRSFGGEFGAKARVARRWMEAYQDSLCQDALFTCLAVNRASPKFEHERFKADYHAYNRFTAMAIKAGISYLLAPLDYDDITLTVVSDGKDRKSRPEQKLVDNFEAYLPYRVELDNWVKQLTTNRPYPTVRMNPVQTIDSAASDLLQLTDILLGATQAALMGISNRPVKQELGRMVARWYQDLQEPLWQQAYGMHRKFNIWGFPDKHGRPFNQFRMVLPVHDPNQLSLL